MAEAAAQVAALFQGVNDGGGGLVIQKSSIVGVPALTAVARTCIALAFTTSNRATPSARLRTCAA